MRMSGNSQKGFLWIFGIVAVFLMPMCLGACNSSPSIIPIGSSVFYTKDELVDLYWKYKDELSEVAEIVLASDAFRQRIIDDHDDDWEIGSEYVKSDFSEENWNKIVELIRTIRPYMLMRSLQAGDDVVYLNFPPQKENGYEISTSLFYFKNLETVERYREFSWVGELEQLDGYWYVEEEIRETRR